MATAAAARERVGSIDLVRGAVMVLMALDHVRDFVSSAHFDPTDLDKTTPGLFFTRWITHFCAPVFVALSGVGAHLQGARGAGRAEVSRFLLTRGLWLVVLELTVVRFGWSFNVRYDQAVAQVIWALGWSMVLLAGLVHLPRRAVGWASLAAIALHGLADRVHAKDLGGLAPLWRIAHEQGPVFLPGQRVFFVAYPLVPWIFVMAAAWAFGDWLLPDDGAVRRRRLLAVGGAAIAGFVVLRASGLWGDPHPWAPGGGALRSALGFLACEKYPPSLCYLGMTLGPTAIALALLERTPAALAPLARALVVFGRVPLFYYLLHLVVIHAAAILLAWARYGSIPEGMFGPPFGWKVPEGYGYGLGGVYAVWAAVVVVLWPACAWFSGVKRRSASPWLRYL